MKRFSKYIYILFIIVCLCTPQTTKSYDFDSKEREQQVKATRREIYDLYNLHKSLLKDKNGDTSQFGVVGYNGVCSNVTVNGKTISLDEYIAGVIKQEMGGNNLEALKAQAIAARSFVLGTHKNSSSCTVANGQNYQAYTDAGVNDIYMQAATETSNMVVSRNGEIAVTQYQSHPAGKWCTDDSNGWHVKFQRFNDDPSSEWTWNGPSKDTVRRTAGDGSLYGTEMDYNNSHHFGMSQTIAMYLAKAENYTYDKIIDLFYAQPIVTITDGNYDGNIKYVDSDFGKITYWNQQDFANYYYSANPTTTNTYGATIKSHGCGPTSVAIVASSMLNREITPVETTQKVCQRNGCTRGGSNFYSMQEVLEKDYGLSTRWTGDNQDLINALGSKNSLAIVLMGRGVFTSGGHYIVLTGVNSQGQVSVADPNSTERTQAKWFSFNTIIEQRKYDKYLIITR